MGYTLITVSFFSFSFSLCLLGEFSSEHAISSSYLSYSVFIIIAWEAFGLYPTILYSLLALPFFLVFLGRREEKEREKESGVEMGKEYLSIISANLLYISFFIGFMDLTDGVLNLVGKLHEMLACVVARLASRE